MNWDTSYKTFIEKKAVPKEKRVKHPQKHHVIPISRGGRNGDNLVRLRRLDHVIAHILLALADRQNNRRLIDYHGPNYSLNKTPDNILKRYPPLLKIKFKHQFGTMTLTEFVKLQCEVNRLSVTEFKNRFICKALFEALFDGKTFGHKVNIMM